MAENRRLKHDVVGDHTAMLELRLQSGTVVAFDGRVLEVFNGDGGSRRFHVAGVRGARLVEGPNGAGRIIFAEPALHLAVAREERPASARLVGAIEQARADDDALGTP